MLHIYFIVPITQFADIVKGCIWHYTKQFIIALSWDLQCQFFTHSLAIFEFIDDRISIIGTLWCGEELTYSSWNVVMIYRNSKYLNYLSGQEQPPVNTVKNLMHNDTNCTSNGTALIRWLVLMSTRINNTPGSACALAMLQINWSWEIGEVIFLWNSLMSVWDRSQFWHT
jgi:hypothetical protein